MPTTEPESTTIEYVPVSIAGNKNLTLPKDELVLVGKAPESADVVWQWNWSVLKQPDFDGGDVKGTRHCILNFI